MDEHEAMRRGQLAAEVLNNPIYEESWTEVEKQFFEAIKSSPQRDVAGRESIAMAIKLLSRVRAYLEGVVTTGKMAAVRLDEKQTFKDYLRRMTEWTG